MDIKTYRKYFTILEKKEKKTFLLQVLGKVQKKSPTLDKLCVSLKKAGNISTIFLDDIFENLIKLISHLSQKQKSKNIDALENIHKKIQKITQKEEKEKKQEDVEAILHKLYM